MAINESDRQLPAAPGRLWATGLIENLSHALPASYHELLRLIHEFGIRRHHPLPDEWYIARVGKAELKPQDFQLRQGDFKARQHLPGISAGIVFAGKRERNALIVVARGRLPEERDNLHFARVGDIRRLTAGHVDVIYSPVGHNGDQSHVIITSRDPHTGQLTQGDFPEEVRQILSKAFVHEKQMAGWPASPVEISRSGKRRTFPKNSLALG